jgi:DNA-binding CsgD family transcriptional regulator
VPRHLGKIALLARRSNWSQNVVAKNARAAPIRTGSPLFQTTRGGRIVEWNRSAEELTGIPAGDAVGCSCWDVVRGRDADGSLICHPGCSIARLAREGWPVRCTDLAVAMPSGVKRVTVSTIVVGAGEDASVLHTMDASAPAGRQAPGPDRPELTPRQREILALLADGLCAKEIAARLSLSVATVRNHIHGLLRRLGVSSQLAAVAKAHELGLCEPPSGRATRPR